MSSGRRTCSGCASLPNSNMTPIRSACCSPTTRSTGWRLTCDGSITPRPGWTCSTGRCAGDREPRRRCGTHDREHRRGAGPDEVVRRNAGAARRLAHRAAGRDRRGHGAKRLWQVHLAALPGRHPGPRRRRGVVRRAAAGHPERRPAQRAAPGPVRVRVPVRSAGPRADRGRKRRPAPAAVGHPPRTGDDGGQELVSRARPGRARAPQVRGAVRRAGTARRAGPRPGRQPAGAVRRRADRVAGLCVRRAGDGAAHRRRPRARHHRHPGHPRRPGRRLRGPRGRRQGRQGQHAHRGHAVIPLGLRLVLSGGREALTRFLVLAIAVGLGVGLLLTAVAATNAVTTWNNSHAWLWTGTSFVPPGPATAGIAPLWWHPVGDTFDGQNIYRFDVAATGTSSPVPPGIPRDPGPGQYYASPALAALLRSTPADQLAVRYPGRLAGTIGDAALPSPSSLVIIVGRTPAQLAHTPDSVQVTSISTTVQGWPVPPTEASPQGLTYVPPNPGGGAGTVDLIMSVVALAILAPVLIFIATATRLSAARREERFAAMRLAGATRRQVSLLAATESTVAGIAGVAAGFGIFFLLRIPVAGIPFVGQPFFPGMLSPSLPDILAVAIGVPVAAAVAALLALRRVQIS